MKFLYFLAERLESERYKTWHRRSGQETVSHKINNIEKRIQGFRK